jgi:replicative DNA helicase
MAPEDNAERMLTAAYRDKGGRVTYRDARNGRMLEEEFRGVIECGRDMERLPFHFIEPSIRSLTRLQHEIRRHTRRFQRQGRPVLIVIDYLQQIDPGGRSRYEIVSDASMGIKALAIELRTPILVLSQLSRRVEDRNPQRPMLADLRDSGQLEQDANTVLMLFRPD